MSAVKQPTPKSAFALATVLTFASGIAALPTASIAAPERMFEAQPKMPVFILRDARGEQHGNDRKGLREAVLMDDWLYRSPKDGRVYLVPAGYTTDFASIPWYGKWFVDQFGKHAEAAVIHDWLYAVGNRGPKVRYAMRKDADDRMRVAMQEQDVHPAREWVVYWSVRIRNTPKYGSEEEFNNNWTKPDPYSVGESMDPPIDKPSVLYIAEGVTKEQFTVVYQQKLRFLYGTMPDKCSDLRGQTINLGEAATAELLYEKCLNTHPYNTFLDGVTHASQCTNKAN